MPLATTDIRATDKFRMYVFGLCIAQLNVDLFAGPAVVRHRQEDVTGGVDPTLSSSACSPRTTNGRLGDVTSLLIGEKQVAVSRP